MNNTAWQQHEDNDALTMDAAAFLAKHNGENGTIKRTANGLRFRIAKLNKEPAEVPVVLAPDDGEADEEEVTPEAYDRYFALIEEAVELERELGTGVSIVERSFGNEPIIIFFTSDWHIGAGGVEYGRLRRDLEAIRDQPGAYAVFNGDGLENTKTHSKSASALYSAAIPKPRHQLELLKRMGSIPGTDEQGLSKFLAWAEGNHDAFDYRAAGVDRIAGLAEELGVPYFREKGGTLRVTVGGQLYTIIVKHQYTGQSRISKSNSARRLFTEWPWHWDTADVVALAHLHEPDLHVTMQRGRDVHFIRSGSYKTSDAWAESNGFCPTYGVPAVILYPGERKILSFHGSQFDDALRIYRDVRGSWAADRNVVDLHRRREEAA